MDLVLKFITNKSECKNAIGFEISRGDLEIIRRIIASYNFGSTLESEDVLQDLMVKLIEDFNFHGDSEYATNTTQKYIKSITHRFCKDKYKYEKRRVHQNIDLPKYFNSAFIDAPEIQDAQLDLSFFENAVSEKYQLAVNLNFNGYSHEDISKKLGITISASRKRLQRARQMLKEWFYNEHNPSMLIAV